MKKSYLFFAAALIAMVDGSFAADDFDASVVEITRPAAEQGDAQAQLELGNAYHQGVGVPLDDAEAVKWWNKSSAQGNMEAGCQLSMSYGKIAEITKEDAAAAKAICDAGLSQQVQALNAKVATGDPEAELALGKMYNMGIGVPRDDKQAAKLWKDAFRQGNKNAGCHLVAGFGDNAAITREDAEAAKKLCNIYNPRLDE
jgi:uncharacterized protein